MVKVNIPPKVKLGQEKWNHVNESESFEFYALLITEQEDSSSSRNNDTNTITVY